MVLELLIYAKSVIKFFDQSEASFGSHMTTNQLPWVGWRGSMQKTQNSRRMIWNTH